MISGRLENNLYLQFFPISVDKESGLVAGFLLLNLVDQVKVFFKRDVCH